MANPLVSICMITYNHEPFIAQAIEGVLMQKTDFQFELVIGEDYSNDNTRKICKKYKNQYPDKIILLESKKNLGMTPNFIRTLEACTGKYIALCEGDDYWTDPLKLQKQVDFLEANKDYVLCFHDTNKIDANGNVIANTRLENYSEILSEKQLICGTFIPTLTVVFRNFIKTYPKQFKEVKNPDTILFSLLGQYGKGRWVKNIQNSMYRVHQGGVWSLLGESVKLINSIKTLTVIQKNIPKKFKTVIQDIKIVQYKRLLISLLKEKKIKKYIRTNFKIVFIEKINPINFYISHLKGVRKNFILRNKH